MRKSCNLTCCGFSISIPAVARRRKDTGADSRKGIRSNEGMRRWALEGTIQVV